MLLQQDHCKMDTAERGRAWACFQMLMIINVIGSSRDIVVCFLDGFYNNPTRKNDAFFGESEFISSISAPSELLRHFF